MEERIQKAFDIANYMATLASQKQILKEEYSQNLIFFYNGGTFNVDQTLICFVKTLVDLGNSPSAVLVDANSIPIDVQDLKKFLEDVMSVYYKAVNQYYTRYSQLRTSRTVEKIIEA